MASYTPNSFKPLLDRLVQTPEYFTADDLKSALNHLFSPDAVSPVQIGAFLTAIHIHRVERRPDSLAAAAAVLRERSLKAIVEEPEGDFIVDIVGTGGDGYNLFNVSTTAGIVAAGAGARVIKVSMLLLRSTLDVSNPVSTAAGPPPQVLARRICFKPWAVSSLPRIQGRQRLFPAYPSLSSLHPITTPHSPSSRRTAKPSLSAPCSTF